MLTKTVTARADTACHCNESGRQWHVIHMAASHVSHTYLWRHMGNGVSKQNTVSRMTYPYIGKVREKSSNEKAIAKNRKWLNAYVTVITSLPSIALQTMTL